MCVSLLSLFHEQASVGQAGNILTAYQTINFEVHNFPLYF